nr:histidine kinase dimerization/phospho-acceptor domain-containing protein [Desulforamulus aquiferis]
MSGEMGQITKAINRMAANLSEKEHMAEQLRRSEYLSELGRFVTDIAHELRSPVSIIQTTVDLMEPRVKNQSDLKECVEMIQKQLDRHSRLTTELLNFGSPTQVKMDPLI